MGGEEFAKANLRGKGIRIAVLDGGFPLVDKHAAFQHLRDNGRILKTYNFPKKQENVYGWNSHGTMTLSCIAGKDVINKCDIGLATEAEFLLARTEVGPEPKKEEVWWVMGLEWADKNGAQIVSSSLGYGDINHEISELDGSSPISQAANAAVAKGILICNSMGNEGTKASWRTLILPADAEHVLTVGGIDPNTQLHQDFSSYGPTSDGRLKPNVVAYASECRAANPNGEKKYSNVAGTSFSCPLVAGFAACAWQGHPEYTALQLKAEIEKSGDVYPYYDYAIGYGVPQAAYFTGNQVKAEKLFDIVENEYGLYIQINDNYRQGDMLYYHTIDNKGHMEYKHITFNYAFDGKVYLSRYNGYLEGSKICVHYKGYTENYVIKKTHVTKPLVLEPNKKHTRDTQYSTKVRNPGQASQWGSHAKNKFGAFYGFGTKIATSHYDCMCDVKMNSIAQNIGVYYQRNITKGYGLGVSLSNSFQKYSLKPAAKAFPATTTKPAAKKAFFNENQLDLELYQQIRLASGYNGSGCSLDIGVFGFWVYDYTLTSIYPSEGNVVLSRHSETFKFDGYPFDWGFSMRVNYAFLSLYAKLRSGVFDSGIHLDHYIPFQQYTLLVDTKNLEIGLMMKF
jgi:hypothetical protein